VTNLGFYKSNKKLLGEEMEGEVLSNFVNLPHVTPILIITAIFLVVAACLHAASIFRNSRKIKPSDFLQYIR